jgi:hypothetical protein
MRYGTIMDLIQEPGEFCATPGAHDADWIELRGEKRGTMMNSSLKFLLAATALTAVSVPAFATDHVIYPVSTGGNSYSYSINQRASGAGTFTDTFYFTIPGVTDGLLDVGLLNTATSGTTNDVDFTSAKITGPGGLNVPLSVSNGNPVSSVANLASIAVSAGLQYALIVTYSAGGHNAMFNGNISFTAAPEPAAWALMLLGFGVVGAALRYRGARPKQNVSVSYS